MSSPLWERSPTAAGTSIQHNGTADAGGWRPLTGHRSGPVPPTLGSGGLWGLRAKGGSSGAARGAKLSLMAEQGWRPLPQLYWARQQRTQHFLRHGELTDGVWGATNQS